MKQKKAITTYRLHLGWNQEAMAAYIGVGRILLGLAEIGDRELTFSANIKLIDLIQTFEQARHIAMPLSLLQQEN